MEKTKTTEELIEEAKKKVTSEVTSKEPEKKPMSKDLEIDLLKLEIEELKSELENGDTQNKIRTGKKANQHKLNSLHDLLTEYFLDCLDSGQELSSGTLAAMNAFLKNNNIMADISESKPNQDIHDALQSLIEQKQ